MIVMLKPNWKVVIGGEVQGQWHMDTEEDLKK